MRIGERIKYLREAKGLTQKDVATFLGIATSTYTLYELGTILIPTAYIYKIAKKLNYSVDYIITKK